MPSQVGEVINLDHEPHRIAPFWVRADMFALSLLSIFLDTYGTEGLGWLPETIEAEIRDDFGVDIPDLNFDRLMVGISLLTSNSFFVSPTDFTRDCVILAGHSYNTNSMILPDCADLAWGITEGLIISPPEDKEKEPFSKEILGYVGECLDSEGILNAPDVLRIGMRDPSMLQRARYNFSDDVEMMATVTKFENDKTSAINEFVRSNLKALLMQLKELPVAEGRAARLAEHLMARLSESKELPIPG